MKVKECMCNDVCCVKPETKIYEIAKLMSENHIGCIPVCDDNNSICGIVTDRDILLRCVACNKDSNKTPVSDIMTCNVCTCKENDELTNAESKMGENQIRRLPVCDDNNKVTFGLDFGGQRVEAGKVRLDVPQVLSGLPCLGAVVEDLILEHQELLPQGLQCPCDGGDGIQHGLGDALHLAAQLPQEGVVGLDLSVQLAAVGGVAIALHFAGGYALVDGGQLRQATGGVTAVVNAGCLAHALQVAVDRVRPRLPPQNELFVAVPAGGDGVLPSEPGASWGL